MDLLKQAGATVGCEPSPLRLWDFSQSHLALSSEDIREVVAFAQSSKFLPKKVAIFAPDDLSFGLSRIYSTLLEDQSSDTEVRIFRDGSEARSWLAHCHLQPHKYGSIADASAAEQ